MTDKQKRFIELDLKKAEYKKFLEDYKEATTELIKEIGIGGHFQDTDGIVYQAAESDGKFVYYDTLVVNRTRRPYLDEKKGSLSLKKAKELGYEVE